MAFDLTTITPAALPASGILFGATNQAAGSPSVYTFSTTGSGALVQATSPTLVTPVLGTPTSGTLTNCTGLPIAGIAALGTGVAGALAANVTGSGGIALATSPTFTTPVLGAATATSINKLTITQPATGATLTIADSGTLATSGPYSITLTATAATALTLPTSGTVTALGNATTGSGSIVLATSPTLVTPILGTPTSGTLTNCTGLPIAGIAALGAGVATALGTAVTGTGGIALATNAALTTPALAGATQSVSATVTAGTNAQGQSPLTSDINVITTNASNPGGVTLPTPTTGRTVAVYNTTANQVNVYPSTGVSIDYGAANASDALPTDTGLIYQAVSSTQWYSNAYTAIALAAATGTLPVNHGGTGITALGAGVQTALGQAVTGSGGIALATSPSFTTPVLGAATATTINKVTLTAPSTGSTLTIANGKTLTANSSVTIGGTDGTTINSVGNAGLSVTSTTLSGGTLREALTANRTYYVATTGSDSNPGTSGSPFLTIQKAINTIYGLDLAGYTVTVQIADGTYTANTSINAGAIVGGNITINGNATTPANVLISTTSADCIDVSGVGAQITLQNFKTTTTTSGHCLLAQNGANIYLGAGMQFGASAGAHIYAYVNSIITVSTAVAITGGAAYHVIANNKCSLIYLPTTITVTGTCNFSTAFAYVQGFSYLVTGGAITVAGGGTVTGARYQIIAFGGIETGTGASATALPGSVAGSGGTTTGGGYYD